MEASRPRSCLHVYLSENPCQKGDFDQLCKLALARYDRDVIIDFSWVEILDDNCILKLLLIRELLYEAGHKVLLESVRPIAYSVFIEHGVDHLFQFLSNVNPLLELP